MMNRNMKPLALLFLSVLTLLVSTAATPSKGLEGSRWRRYIPPAEMNLTAANVGPDFKVYMDLTFEKDNKGTLTVRIEGMGSEPAESKESFSYEHKSENELIIITKREGGGEDREQATINWAAQTLRIKSEGKELIFNLTKD
ncbi:hypothetical protein [Porphyromonas loveana]|uniref:hypothetical protein n=1 Tax=Porphyromonas loveana TaxID=1884669 RepID=UPI00359FF7C9